jgi:nucleoside-diphosphate-sugar epimerase
VWGPDSSLIDGLAAEARAGRFAWIDGGRYTTDVTYVDNAVEGLLLGWRRGGPGQAYFITDRHRVVLRDFLETLFAIHEVELPTAKVDGAIAAREIPAPASWFLGQECTLRTEKAVDELGYAPVVSQAAGLEAVRRAIAGSTTATVGSTATTA